ncbi:IS110 family transposase [Persephonella sp. IF05-L8]|uniref:IS110 family transposase n=1 Tax=Persephonella sp. IF05-L8 TaxID=1158338 RepID=UPI0004972F07
MGIEFFSNFYDPDKFLAIESEKELQTILKKKLKHFGKSKDKVRKLYEYKIWFQETGYKPDKNSILIFCESLKRLKQLKNGLKETEDLIIKLGNQYEEVQLIKNLPHIKDLSATIIFSEIGDIKRFSSWQKLYAYFGLDPRNSQSGKLELRGKMSKAGIPHIRSLLYMISMSAISSNRGAYREYFLKRKEEGKPSKIIMFAIVQKIIRKIYFTLKYKNLK